MPTNDFRQADAASSMRQLTMGMLVSDTFMTKNVATTSSRTVPQISNTCLFSAPVEEQQDVWQDPDAPEVDVEICNFDIIQLALPKTSKVPRHGLHYACF